MRKSDLLELGERVRLPRMKICWERDVGTLAVFLELEVELGEVVGEVEVSGCIL